MTGDLSQGLDKRRTLVLALLMALGFSVVIGQLIRYQVVEHRELLALSDAQVTREKPIVPARGYITDAKGNLLAMDMVEWDISADPPYISAAQRLTTTKLIAPLLELPEQEVFAVLSTTLAWVPLKSQVPQEVGEAIRDLELAGVQCVPRAVRVYPQGDLTSYIVGFVNSTLEGFYGIEGYYNNDLRPVEGSTTYVQDAGGEPVPAKAKRQDPGRPGTSLVLTVDLNVQYIAQDELQKAIKEYGAESGAVIVMEPKTGAILASVSLPSYDPRDYATSGHRAVYDPNVSGIWEPGSMFKLITWAAALDLGTIAPDTLFFDTACTEIGGRSVCNWDYLGHDWVTAREALARSLNVVSAQISTRLGSEHFYTYVRRFGFGNLTGVDLASEESGMVRQPGDSNWFPSDLGTNSFGQGIAVTPIQMITAVSAIANGGLLVKPHAVSEFITPKEDGSGVETQPVNTTISRRAISEATAQQLREMMVYTVDSFATKAQIPGYSIAGKSSTAQIPTAYGYDPNLTIGSYIGFAPADDPEFVILVRLDKPTSSEWGTQTAGPTFRAIAQRLLLYLEIPPDSVRLANQGQP
ncbi:MAG TPA: penicillin-binding protein 2 [Anaerolineae bacterium]|nr:penicillin-binding protein 2 [Anaerolineae bacterium]